MQAASRLKTVSQDHARRAHKLALRPPSSWEDDVDALFSHARSGSRARLVGRSGTGVGGGGGGGGGGSSGDGSHSHRHQHPNGVTGARRVQQRTAAQVVRASRSVRFSGASTAGDRDGDIDGDGDANGGRRSRDPRASLFVAELDELQPRHVMMVLQLRTVAVRAQRIRLLKLLNCGQSEALRLRTEVGGVAATMCARLLVVAVRSIHTACVFLFHCVTEVVAVAVPCRVTVVGCR